VTGRIYRRSRFVAQRAREHERESNLRFVVAHKIPSRESNWPTFGGEIRTIHTADKPRRVERSHVSRADNSVNSWQSRGVVQDQGLSLFMVTQFSVTSHDCRLARTWSRSHHTERDMRCQHLRYSNNPIRLTDSIISRFCTSKYWIFSENWKFDLHELCEHLNIPGKVYA